MTSKYCLGFLLCIGFAASAQQSYSIQGRITGFPGSGKAFLMFRDGDRKVYDSAIVQGGIFNFTGTVQEPTEGNLYVRPEKPVSDRSSGRSEGESMRLMVEPGKTVIEGEHLNAATVTGAKNQQDLMAYHKAVEQAGDSAYQVWKSQLGTLPEDSAASFHRLLYARAAKSRDAMLRFVETHPASPVSFDVFRQSTVYISNPEMVERMHAVLEPAFGTRPLFKEAAGRLNMVIKLAVGKPAINFTQTDDHGRSVSLSDTRGKFVLIDFWASWCGPCRAEYPHLKKAYAKFRDKNFEIIGISLDDKKTAWLDAIHSNGFEWIQLSDLKGRENAVAKAYGVAAIPQNFLVDPQGNIVARNLRGTELEEKLAQLIH